MRPARDPQAGRHAGLPLPGEMGAAQFRICHCEERSDAAIRVPLCAMRNAEKGERIPTAACGRLGMTGSGEWRIVRHPAVDPQWADTQVGPYPAERVRPLPEKFLIPDSRPVC